MKRVKLAIATLTAMLGIVGGYATAQDAEPSTEAEPTPPDATRTFDENVDVDAEYLSADERLGKAQEKIGRMRQTLSRTTDLLKKVREGEGDILRINCINEKLAAMRGFLKVSEQSYTNLRDAAGRDDDTAQLHHFSLISVSGEKVRDLGEEAETCVGEVEVFADESVVERREDPGIADVDPIVVDDDLFEDNFATETLPELTPFQ